MIQRARADGVLCVGRVYCDIIFTGLDQLPILGEERFASGLSIHVGGGAYITASYFAALNRPVSLLGTLPSGPLASSVNNELLASGINIEHCVSSDDPNDQQITVALSMSGERAFVTKRGGSAMPVERIDWRQHPLIGHLHIGELATLVDHPTLISDAHDVGVSVSLDCSWDDALFERDDIGDYLKGIDIFLPNQAEFDQLKTKYSLTDFLPLCVVKQGKSGACAIVNGTEIKSACPVVEVKDTTGAGDAFNAGFIHAWLNQSSVEECMVIGNQCGATAVSKVGGAA